MTGGFSESAKRALDSALVCARTLGHAYIGSEHLLMGLLMQHDTLPARLLSEQGLTVKELRAQIRRSTDDARADEAHGYIQIHDDMDGHDTQRSLRTFKHEPAYPLLSWRDRHEDGLYEQRGLLRFGDSRTCRDAGYRCRARRPDK